MPRRHEIIRQKSGPSIHSHAIDLKASYSNWSADVQPKRSENFAVRMAVVVLCANFAREQPRQTDEVYEIARLVNVSDSGG
jgi:hypothetical protein